jgi:hypothetical protein
MNVKNVLLTVLVVIALVMIYLSINMGILPPGLTGIGFFIIAFLFYNV